MIQKRIHTISAALLKQPQRTKKYKLDFVEPHILFVYVSMNVAEVKTKSCYTDHTSKNAEMIDFVVTACY